MEIKIKTKDYELYVVYNGTLANSTDFRTIFDRMVTLIDGLENAEEEVIPE